MRTRRGLTLIELLVVVSIIGLLMALLLPAIQASREAARRTECLNNMRQIGIGMQQYIDVNRGHFPWTYHAGAKQSWIVTLAPFMENVDDVRLCPDDPLGRQRVGANAGGMSGTSYVINEYVADATPDHFDVQNINQLSQTSTLPVLFEGADVGRTAADDHVHCSTWYAPGDIYHGTVLATMLAEINPAQHVDCANYLYADGHAATVALTTFYDWVQQDIDNHTNFARPSRD